MKSRITWIDVARGLGILLVLYGHELTKDSWRFVIYAFHMPLFFFLSGIVFHHGAYEKFTTILSKSIRGILLPYFLFAFTTYAFSLAFINHANISQHELTHQILSIFYGNGTMDFISFNNILWFLPCLFVIKVGFAGVTSWVKSMKGISTVLLLLSLGGYFYSLQFPSRKLPFGIESALTGIVFFGLGYLWNTHKALLTRKVKDNLWPVVMGSIVICVVTAIINYNISGHQLDIRLNHLNNYFLTYIGAITGIMATVGISIRINTNRVLEILGQNSLTIFAWHLIVFEVFNKLFLRNIQVSNTFQNVFLTIIYTFFGAGIILGVQKGFRLIRGLEFGS